MLARAIALGVVDRLRLPGFAMPIAPWLAAFDALPQREPFEGLSMATREALAAGLPVVATRVGGQDEHNHARLVALDPDASAATFASHLESLPVRATTLVPMRAIRVPREGSLPLSARRDAMAGTRGCFARSNPPAGVCFVTANLNAGGAQRSLVNLACALGSAVEVAVCGDSTQRAFADVLASRRIAAFRPAPDADPCAVAESLLARAAAAGTRTVCFWNTDPRVKLLVAKTRAGAAAPGRCESRCRTPSRNWMTRAIGRQPSASAPPTTTRGSTCSVLKHSTDAHPACREACVIPNGVVLRTTAWRRPLHPSFLVHGRIAPSKRFETIVAALALAVARVSRISLHVVGSADRPPWRCLARPRHRRRTLPIPLRRFDASLAYPRRRRTGGGRPGHAPGLARRGPGSDRARARDRECRRRRPPTCSTARRCGGCSTKPARRRRSADAMVAAANNCARAQALAEQAHCARSRPARGMGEMAHRLSLRRCFEPATPHEKMAACPECACGGGQQGPELRRRVHAA